MTQARPCKHRDCPVDGGFGAWGACSRSCGGGERKRACDSPAPAAGGAFCRGAMVARCNMDAACPVDGRFGPWGACSKTCAGVATRTAMALSKLSFVRLLHRNSGGGGGGGGLGGGLGDRIMPGVQVRLCTSPAPAHGGKPCEGLRERACAKKPCAKFAVDGGWSEWGGCTRTCGAGLIKRACDSPKPRWGGKACAGKSFEFCSTKACGSADGGWSAWSACTVSCGGGGAQARRCDSPPASGHGKPCSGAPIRVCAAPITCPPRTAAPTPQIGLVALLQSAAQGGEGELLCGDDDDGCTPGQALPRPAAGSVVARALAKPCGDDDDGDCADKAAATAATPNPTPSPIADDDVVLRSAADGAHGGADAATAAAAAAAAPPPPSGDEGDDDALPGANDRRKWLHCGSAGDCPWTDVTTHCDEPVCTTVGQFCTAGGYVCARMDGGGEGGAASRRPRGCSALSAACWVSIDFAGARHGEVWSGGEEVIDCGGGERSAKPTSCQLNNAAVGELCADFKDLFGPWYICRPETTATCFKKPCWHRVVAPTRVSRMFGDPFASLRKGN